MASNGSKPYQAQVISALGLRGPDTLVTTDADAAREFLDRYGEVIYKSTSGGVHRKLASWLTLAHALVVLVNLPMPHCAIPNFCRLAKSKDAD